MKTLLHTLILTTAGLMTSFGAAALADSADLTLVRDITPEYPEHAIRRELGGEVMVRFDVDSKGRARNIEVVESTHDNVFDRSVKTALRRSAFDNHGNRPVEDVERVYRFDASALKKEDQVVMYNAFHQ